MPLEAVLFDLDGTLLDSERESAEAMARALARGLDLAITQADRDFIIGRSWVDIYGELRSRYPALSWTRERLIEETATERVGVFAEMGATVLPGAADTVRGFAHLPRAIVTGSSREEAGQALDLLGLTGAFEAVVASEDVARSKPHPDGYLEGARRLGVSPRRCLVVEDSAAGIAAGRAAGACVVAVRAGNFAGQDQAEAHCVLDTLESLTPDLAEALLARVFLGG